MDMGEQSLRVSAFQLAMKVAADKAMTVEELIVLAMGIEYYLRIGKLWQGKD